MVDTEKIEKMIIEFLRNSGEPRLTREIEEHVQKIGGAEDQCADAIARALNKLRMEGKIEGKIDLKKRGWVWWLK